MWKNNRPEGWRNDYRRAADACSRLGNMHDGMRANSEAIAFEAGADAMLEGLRKGATRVNNIGDLPKGKGVLVFIPD